MNALPLPWASSSALCLQRRLPNSHSNPNSFRLPLLPSLLRYLWFVSFRVHHLRLLGEGWTVFLIFFLSPLFNWLFYQARNLLLPAVTPGVTAMLKQKVFHQSWVNGWWHWAFLSRVSCAWALKSMVWDWGDDSVGKRTCWIMWRLEFKSLASTHRHTTVSYGYLCLQPQHWETRDRQIPRA